MSYESDMTIEQFCAKHDACSEGQDWALEHCETMQDVWRLAKPEWLLWVAFCDGVLPLSKLVEAAVFFTRKIIRMVHAPVVLELWAAAEKLASGELTSDQLWSMRNRLIDANELFDEPHATWAVLSTVAAIVVPERSRVPLYVALALENVVNASENVNGGFTAHSMRVEQAAWFREHTEPCFKI